MIGLYNLWLINVGIWIFAWIVMEIADKLRGLRIENKEDHRNIKIAITGMVPFLLFFGITIFTPIVIGNLFWVGCVLIVLAGIIYILSTMAFVKAKKGLTTIGIYKISRNPMYVAMFLILVAFTLMVWTADSIMGILTGIIALLNTITTHWMVLGEERFLKSKYGEQYLRYKQSVPRYL